MCSDRPAPRWEQVLGMLAGLAVVLCAAPAMAHKLNVWATVEGRTIRGETYFRGGTPAQGAKVTAYGPDGKQLGRATTDAEGKFSLVATSRCDHRLVVDAGAGHGGEYTVRADELPEDLPGVAGGAESARANVPSREPKPAADSASTPQPPAAPADAAELKAMIESALQRKIAPLERKLYEYQQRIGLRDIIGGIGYIVGLAGLWFYFLGTKKKRLEREITRDQPRN